MSRISGLPMPRPASSFGTVRLPRRQGRVSAGVALAAAILGTTIVSLVVAIFAG